MIQKSLVILALTSSVCADQLGYAFEMVRHGARAPLFPQPPNVFQVPGGCLTGEGMRQRLLLGGFNRERYIEEYGLLDPEYNPVQVYVQATDVHRVLQSTYAELMGMFPPTSTQAKVVARAMPPMKVRANLEASIDGLTLVPVYSYLPPSTHDDINQKGCYYVDQCI